MSRSVNWHLVTPPLGLGSTISSFSPLLSLFSLFQHFIPQHLPPIDKTALFLSINVTPTPQDSPANYAPQPSIFLFFFFYFIFFASLPLITLFYWSLPLPLITLFYWSLPPPLLHLLVTSHSQGHFPSQHLLGNSNYFLHLLLPPFKPSKLH